jgi:mannose-6-phosphate isomerase-like protein (cupin superfamily)
MTTDRPTVLHTDSLPVERWDDPDRGSVTWRTVFSGERTPTSGLTLGIAELAPDDTVGNPPHRHAPPEVYYVIAGEGVVTIAGEASPVRAGSAVFIPGEAEHSLANTGSTTLRLLYGFAVDSFDEVTYQFSDVAPAADGTSNPPTGG